jgi:hypothetical protein
MRGRFRLLPLFFAATILGAKDVAVLVDVSGTMANYGAWQSDARALLTGILSGTSTSAAWRREGVENAPDDFRLDGGDHVQLLRFGSIQSREFPFFTPYSTLGSVRELESSFPVDVRAFREARTNKPLAMGVGARLATGSDGTARLIVISDFLVDSDATPEQETFVNTFESTAKIETPLIYSWISNPKVQIKLLRITRPPEPLPADSKNIAPIRITGARVMDRPRRLLLTWVLSGNDEDATYSVTIRDPKSNRTVVSRSVLNSSLLVPNPPSGKFVWQVTAKLSGGRTGQSPITALEIPGEGSVGTIAIVLVAILVGVGAWQYSKRRKSTPEQERKEKTAWKT